MCQDTCAGCQGRWKRDNTVPSQLALARRLSSGAPDQRENRARMRHLLQGVPNFASHSRMVASCPPVASRLPLGAKARQVVPLVYRRVWRGGHQHGHELIGGCGIGGDESCNG